MTLQQFFQQFEAEDFVGKRFFGSKILLEVLIHIDDPDDDFVKDLDLQEAVWDGDKVRDFEINVDDMLHYVEDEIDVNVIFNCIFTAVAGQLVDDEGYGVNIFELFDIHFKEYQR